MTPTPSGSCSTRLASAGNIEASVLPPAVGASTTAFLPSKMASPASSCTGRSEVQPKRETIASWSRGGKRAKAVTSLELHRSHGVTLFVVGFRLVLQWLLALSSTLLDHRLRRRRQLSV